ncbi:MAG TPA: hypothetical protein VH142_09050 [Polyangiaceae bacterium]|jgi:hypothetical protein|nr:hypothetical protein [Polyangiaceae bacterium]
MPVTQSIVRLGLFVSLLAPLPGVVSCGGGGPPPHVLPKPSDMPEGAEWSGVYFSPTYGNLHLIKDGATASGKWRTAAGDKWGELSGNVTGDLFTFEWKETTIGMVGPSAMKTGRGYFKFVRPPGEHVNDEIHGEWGLGTTDYGVSWDAVKQRNAKPDPDSVVPDETQRLEGNGDWDSDKRKKSGGGGDDKKTDDGWN